MAKDFKGSRRWMRELAGMVKGFANHWRIEIMFLLADNPELSLWEISRELGANFKTISEHARRLNAAGLIMKRYDGNSVRHKLTPRGNSILKFLRILE